MQKLEENCKNLEKTEQIVEKKSGQVVKNCKKKC